jgi:tRNA nucleotidyltransferase (CCA-adding enzyme)
MARAVATRDESEHNQSGFHEKGVRMDTARWEHFSHQADVGVRGLGATLEQAFEQAALALTAVITDPATVVHGEMIRLSCEAPDAELLLVDWLNLLIYEMATRNMLFSRFEVHLEDNRLSAQAWGEALETARHHPAVEVKGATYTELKVARQSDGGWLAQTVVDV